MAVYPMKRLFVALLFALALVPPAAHADEPIGCALTTAPLMAQPDGSILIGCNGGISDAFGEQLVLVLNQILQNRMDPETVLAKLGEVASIPDEGIARTVNEVQRHAIIEALSGKDSAQVAIVAHPLVDDAAEFAKGIAAPLTMVGWQIEGNQIRRAAPRTVEAVTGVAIVVRDRDAAPPKAALLKKALGAGSVAAQLVSDPSLPENAAMIWIGRRPVFMKQ
jgi:hypothetical protein